MELWERNCPVILPKFLLPRTFRDLLHAGNLRHGTDGFTSPPKEDVLRIFYYVYRTTILGVPVSVYLFSVLDLWVSVLSIMQAFVLNDLFNIIWLLQVSGYFM